MELKGGKSSIFEEIAEQYKKYIEVGVVEDGERLPSCRELAIRLGINPNTVERAYSLLESQGYVVTLPKKGTYAVRKSNKESSQQQARQLLCSLKAAGMSLLELQQLLKSIYEEN